MPKSTTKKDTKGTKTKKPVTTKKVETKKTVTKKAPVKKVETKKVVKNETEKVEVKNTVTTETKKVKAPNLKKERKFNELISKLMDNTPFVIALCVIVVLVAALIFVLCIKRVPKTSEGKEIVASLKGKDFTADELYESLKEDYGTDSLIKLVDNYIVSKEVTITDEDKEYAKGVVEYYKDYANYYGVDLITFLANYVGLNGITTEDEFFDFVLDDYKKTLAVIKLIGDNAKDEDLKNYYKENYTDKLTVKHILIEVDSEAEDSEKANNDAYNKAKELINTLNSTSAKELDKKFEELAEDNSDDTATYSNGGLIEDFSKKDVVEEFYKAASELKNGEYTKEPVKTTYGYHIILKVSSTPVEKYENIKDSVKKSYAESLISNDATLMTTKWDELRKQYKFSIKDDFIKKSYKNSLKIEDTDTEEE